MDATQVLARIDELEHEVGALRKQEAAGDDPSVRRRLSEAQLELDRLWDLRRRQQAAREAGNEQPREVRSAETVEQYRQ